MTYGSTEWFCAHFSDRGHLFQADRGRRFRAIVDAQGVRASEGLMVSQVDSRGADLSTAADGACDVPADAVGKSCCGLRWWHSLVFLLIAQRGALEVNAVTAVHDTVQNRIGQGRIVQVGMPGLDWELAGDQG